MHENEIYPIASKYIFSYSQASTHLLCSAAASLPSLEEVPLSHSPSLNPYSLQSQHFPNIQVEAPVLPSLRLQVMPLCLMESPG